MVNSAKSFTDLLGFNVFRYKHKIRWPNVNHRACDSAPSFLPSKPAGKMPVITPRQREKKIFWSAEKLQALISSSVSNGNEAQSIFWNFTGLGTLPIDWILTPRLLLNVPGPDVSPIIAWANLRRGSSNKCETHTIQCFGPPVSSSNQLKEPSLKPTHLTTWLEAGDTGSNSSKALCVLV